VRWRDAKSEARRDLVVLAAGLLAALAIRCLFLLWLRDHNNLLSWRIVANVLATGKDLYRDTDGRYNYSPLWAGIVWILARVAVPLGLSLDRAVSLFLTAVDVATAAVLFRIALERTESRRTALAAALLFFANPVSAIVSGSLGAFDNLAIFFLLLSIPRVARPVSRARTVGAMSLSLLAKHVAWFHPLLLARRREQPRVGLFGALVPYAVFFVSFLPFWASREAIRTRVFGYSSLDEPYGLEPLRFWRFLPQETLPVIFVATGLVAVYALRQVEFGRACLLLFLVNLIFLPGIGQNYFVWPIALGALYPSLGYAVYSVMIALFLIHSPDALAIELPHLPDWSGPWWAAVLWLLLELRGMRGGTAAARAIKTNAMA
jgi:hypothetical protein